MSGPIVRGLTELSPSTIGTATKVTVDRYGRVTALGTADLSGTDVTGILAAARFPALTGDVTTVAGALATTIAKLSAFTTNGFVKTSAGNGTITIDTSTYLTSVDWANPGTIGNNTPNTGAFTTVAVGGPAVTELTVYTTSNADPRGILSGQYSTDANGSRVHLRKARGTIASPTIIVTGDTLGRIRFSGYDGANFLQMASIDAISTGTVASTRIPTYLSFSVATDAAPSVLTEVARFTITGLNNAAVGATTPSTGAFTNLTITNGGYIRPSANSTSAILFTKADGTTTLGSIDSTNGIFKFGTTSAQGVIIAQGATAADNSPVLGVTRNTTGWLWAVTMSGLLVISGGSTYTDAAILTATKFSFDSGGRMNVGTNSTTLNNFLSVNGSASIGTLNAASSNGLIVNGNTGLGMTANNAAARLEVRGATSGVVAIFRAAQTTPSDIVQYLADNGTNYGSVSSIGVAVHIPLDAATATVTNALVIDHSTSGTPAASYGTGLSFKGQSSTTVSRDMGRIRTIWTTATDASRKARGIWSAFDTAERDCISIEASGSAAMIGFYATAPIVQPTTAIAGATRVGGGGAALTDTDTFDGYTIAQLAKVIRNLGLAA